MVKLNESLSSASNFCKTLVADTQKAIEQFHADNIAANEDKHDKENAVNKLIYELLKIWGPQVILPATMLILAFYFIKAFLVPICLVAFAVYALYDKLAQQQAIAQQSVRQQNIDSYIFVRDFIFQSLCELKDYLPIKQPQTVFDIVHIPEFVQYDGYELFAYKLNKLTSEQTDSDKIAFAEKITQAKITQKMDKWEALHQDGSTFVNDVRKIQLSDITDMGTHYLVLVAFVDNEQIYEYIKNKITAANKPQKAQQNSAHDTDF